MRRSQARCSETGIANSSLPLHGFNTSRVRLDGVCAACQTQVVLLIVVLVFERLDFRFTRKLKREPMAFDYPEDLKYRDSHEYARLDGDVATIGITAFAIDQLGDIVFLELPEVGDALTKGEAFGTVESVKAVEDLVAPVSGTVLERNDPLLDTPEQLSDDPYGEAWMLKVRINDAAELEDAMTADAYRAQVEGE